MSGDDEDIGEPVTVNTPTGPIVFTPPVGCTFCGEPSIGVAVPKDSDVSAMYSDGLPLCEAHRDDNHNFEKSDEWIWQEL